MVRASGGITSRYGYILDGRGNVVALVDNTGTVQDRYSYGLWGNLVSSTDAIQQPFLYAGYWYDRELGWYWLSVREYDPVLERFLQPDPSFLEGIWSYVFAGDNPNYSTDPIVRLNAMSSTPLVQVRPQVAFQREQVATEGICFVVLTVMRGTQKARLAWSHEPVGALERRNRAWLFSIHSEDDSKVLSACQAHARSPHSSSPDCSTTGRGQRRVALSLEGVSE